MRNKKNIKSKRSLRSQAIWGVVTLGILVVLWLAVEKRSNASLQQVVVEIIDLKDKKNLISEKAILKKCKKHLGFDLSASTVAELDMRKLEQMLNSDKRIKDAQVYIDNRQSLHIGILQRQPIARIQSDKTAYYLDEEGGRIPLVKGATIRVPLVTGEVGIYDPAVISGEKSGVLKDIYTMAKHIADDKFLTSLIEQMDVDANREFTLAPKVGKQKLLFGKAEMVEDRFENLKIFYKEGMPKVGWRKFEMLALNWDGQIVGVKSK